MLMRKLGSKRGLRTTQSRARWAAIACLVVGLSSTSPVNAELPKNAELGKELDRILAIARKKNPQVRPTKPSRYTPQNMTQNLLLWGDSTTLHRSNRRFNSIAWIDNQRVLLVGSEDKRPIANAMFVWDTVKATVTPYGDHKYFCYADGYLVSFPSIDKGPIRRGLVGKETDEDFNKVFKASLDSGWRPILDMQCRESLRWQRPSQIGAASKVVADLGKREGMVVTPITTDWLDRHRDAIGADYSGNFRVPMVLVNDRFPRGKPLPIWAIEEIRSISYSEYRQRYVVTPIRPKHGMPIGNVWNWPADIPYPVYQITEGGDAETIVIPNTAGWEEAIEAQPAKPGLVFYGSGVRGNLGGGMYLYDGTDVLALDIGRPEVFVVSPDGCKLAYAINNSYDRPGKPQVPVAQFKFINFCQE
jgi:hypothetical protein